SEAAGLGTVFRGTAACAVPAVAGRSGGAHEAVVAGETGYVVEPRDVRAVRSALGELCEDPGLRSGMGRAARERAVAEYSYDRLVTRLLPIARGDFSGAAILP